MTVKVEYIAEQIDSLVKKIDKQQDDLDNLKVTVAEIRGARKMVEWLRALIAGLIGAVASLVSILTFFNK